MKFNILLNCTVLYSILYYVLYWNVLYCTVYYTMYYTELYCIVQYAILCTVLNCACTVLYFYCIVLNCTKLYCTVLNAELYSVLYCIIMYCAAVGWRRSTICSSTGTVRSSRQQHRSTSLIPGQCSSIHLFIISFPLCLFIHFLLIYSFDSSFYHSAIYSSIHSSSHTSFH